MIAWKYVGSGEWIAGIPARDLTEEEAEPHLADLKASRLYDKVTPKRGRRNQPDEPPAEEE